jgi:hypothetical protein
MIFFTGVEKTSPNYMETQKTLKNQSNSEQKRAMLEVLQ